jgi:hypothetical protein
MALSSTFTNLFQAIIAVLLQVKASQDALNDSAR